MSTGPSDSLVGRAIAHFEVSAKLGEGGMGSVYRARDTKLERDVALKVLPDNLTDDPERLARFRREAQNLAALNHANIGSIYGLEEIDGRLILVLELVEGEDLGERIGRGTIPMEEAVDIASQMAAGLEEAHERGLVHRDLKPANLIVTDEGVVKVLDFGLAKAYRDDASVDEVADLATVTGADLTRDGVIMGTAAYMSPEQARGRPVDRRTDVWAFGCVLYEMITGRRAFGGDTMTDILVSVVSGEPDWELLPPETPPGVRRLLRRCLRRDRRNRLRSLGDAALELAEADDEPAAGPLLAVRDTPPSRGLALWAVVGPIVGVLAGLGLWMVLDEAPAATPRSASRFATVSEPVAVAGSYAPSLAVSPDGESLVYAAGAPPRLLVKRRDQLHAAPVAGTEGATAPFFSPDGREIGFWADGALRRIPTAGGDAVLLCETTRYFFGAVWAEDGFIYFSRPWVSDGGETTVAVVRVPADGGGVEVVGEASSADGRTVGLSWPTVLPGGGRLLVTRWSTSGAPPVTEVLSTVDGSRSTVIEGVQQARFLPPNQLVAAGPDGNLVAMDFDPVDGRTTSEPRIIARDAQRARYGTMHFAAGTDGVVHWVPDTGSTRADELVWVDGDGTVSAASDHRRAYEMAALSPSGDFAVVSVRDAQKSINVWLLDLVRDTLQPLTIGRGYSRHPLWSPRGPEVVFSVPLGNEALPAGIYRLRVDEQAEPELIVPGTLRVPTAISPDGEWLYFHTIGAERTWDVRRVNTGTGEIEAAVEAPFDASEARVSPDGGWLAFEADPAGRTEIFVRRLDGISTEGQVSPHGGRWPVWSPRGDELFYLGSTHLMGVSVRLGDEPAVDPARELFPVGDSPGVFDVSSNGERFLMIRRGEEPRPNRINMVVDWQEAAAATPGGQG